MEPQVVFEPFNQISRARNTGARLARGKYLVFLDADTLVPQGSCEAHFSHLRHGRCVAAARSLILEDASTCAASSSPIFWNLISMRCGLAAGSFIYCLQEAFEAVGGFSEKVYASEEIWFSRRLKRWGKKRGQVFWIITRHRAVTSSRKLDHPVRNILGSS